LNVEKSFPLFMRTISKFDELEKKAMENSDEN
jgi:hypothetical protein